MKTPLSPRPLLLAASTLAACSAIQAAPFTAGNLVVARVGTGTAALSGASSAVFLDEFTTAGGTAIQSLPLPVAANGAQQPLTAAGTSTSEALLTRSTDRRYLLLTGYAAAPGTAAIAATTSAATPRVVARIDDTGAIDTTTALTDFSTASNPRSAVSTNGSDLWVAGGAGGVRYTTFGSTTSTQLSTTVANLRQLRIFDGQLYTTSGSGAFRLASIGTGLPTTTGQTITNLPGLPTSGGSPYGFFMADLDASVPGVDTIYASDDGGGTGAGFLKFSLVGGTWVSNGNLVASGVRSLTASVSGTSVTLYGCSNTALFTLTDTSGYNAAITGTVSTLATAGTNTAFRGIDWAPVSAAPPSTIDTWRVAKFGPGATNSGLTANAADFDIDGISNILEYALGTQPNDANGANGSSSLPAKITGSADPLLNDRLALAFTIPSPAPADITYIVQASDDLTTWTPVATKVGTGAWTWNPGGTSHIVTTAAGATELVRVGDLVPLASASSSRRMMRLSVTNP